MTKEQLDAIRTRVEAGPARGLVTQIEIDRDGTTRWVHIGPYLCFTHEDAAKVRDVVSFVHHAPTDLRALLAEVERLNAERDALQVGDSASTALGANERFAPSEYALVYIEKWCDGSGPCAVELEPHGHWRLSRSVPLSSVRKTERDAAFKRGVAAMREAAAQRCEISPIHGEKTTTGRKYADAVRALPDPKDTE